jgi:hypothetical protein
MSINLSLNHFHKHTHTTRWREEIYKNNNNNKNKNNNNNKMTIYFKRSTKRVKYHSPKQHKLTFFFKLFAVFRPILTNPLFPHPLFRLLYINTSSKYFFVLFYSLFRYLFYSSFINNNNIHLHHNG